MCLSLLMGSIAIIISHKPSCKMKSQKYHLAYLIKCLAHHIVEQVRLLHKLKLKISSQVLLTYLNHSRSIFRVNYFQRLITRRQTGPLQTRTTYRAHLYSSIARLFDLYINFHINFPSLLINCLFFFFY